MKRILFFIALALGFMSPAMAAAVSFPDVPTAKEKAKAENKPVLVLWHGSDWLPGSEALCKDWEALARSGLPVVFGQFDERLGLEGNARSRMLPVEEFNLPAAVLLAPDGTFMADFSGPIVREPKKLAERLKKLLPRASRFAELSATARSASGVEGAKAAGQALSLVSAKDAMRNNELVRIINDKDPGDATGYRSLYGLEHMGMYREINNLLNGGPDGGLKGAERHFDKAEQYVRDVLNRKMVKGERLQQWLAGLAYVQRERMLSSQGARDVKPLVDTYKAIAKIDPESQYGKGAARLARYWDPKTAYTIKDGFYNSSDQTHGFEKDWHVDVTSSIDGAGAYVFSLVPMDNGPMVTRNFRLMVNGKEVAKAPADPQTNTKTVEFAVPAVAKGAKVEVWLTAQCNDGWFGCQGYVEMKKKDRQ